MRIRFHASSISRLPWLRSLSSSAPDLSDDDAVASAEDRREPGLEHAALCNRNGDWGRQVVTRRDARGIGRGEGALPRLFRVSARVRRRHEADRQRHAQVWQHAAGEGGAQLRVRVAYLVIEFERRSGAQARERIARRGDALGDTGLETRCQPGSRQIRGIRRLRGHGIVMMVVVCRFLTGIRQ